MPQILWRWRKEKNTMNKKWKHRAEFLWTTADRYNENWSESALPHQKRGGRKRSENNHNNKNGSLHHHRHHQHSLCYTVWVCLFKLHCPSLDCSIPSLMLTLGFYFSLTLALLSFYLILPLSPLTHFLDSYNKCLCLQMQNYKIMGNLFLMHIVRLLFFCSFLFGMRCRLVLRHYFSCSKWYKKKWFWFELVHLDISLACWNDFRLALDFPLVRPHHTQIEGKCSTFLDYTSSWAENNGGTEHKSECIQIENDPKTFFASWHHSLP